MPDELAKDKVRVVAVNPGPVGTQLGAKVMQGIAQMMNAPLEAVKENMMKQSAPMGKIASPQDIANTITFLASVRAGAISGTAVNVDAAGSRGLA